MTRTDVASRVIAAEPGRVFAALIDPGALVAWLPPTGMTARFEWFDARPGGGYRLELRYDEPGAGKTTADTDMVAARFVEIDPGRRVVQDVDFDAEDPSYAGTMRMTWTVSTAAGGAMVQVRAENVPPGISAEDHAAGLASSLANLAEYVELSPDGGGGTRQRR
ncbi:SRPBCC family protein [Nocardioides limicola]|uniref:SRPBCC family protein n=1 Tax=Nocardioides limicola TaxID=2803368 RepID=UPI00193B2AFC|nr:SRPBCC family protein [Nocardioides sp. DJM-14]